MRQFYFFIFLLVWMVRPIGGVAQTLADADRLLAEADTLSMQGRCNEALPKAEQAKVIFERLVGKECLQVADALHYMGRCYARGGEQMRDSMMLLKALNVNKQALDIRLIGYKDKPNFKSGSSYHNLGRINLNLNRIDDAIYNISEAIKIYKNTLEPNNPLLVACYNILFDCYNNNRNFETGYTYFNNLLQERSLTLLSQQSIEIGLIKAILGDFCYQTNRIDNATNNFQDAISIFKNILEPNHNYFLITYDKLANCYNAKQDFEGAFNYFSLLLDERNKSIKGQKSTEKARLNQTMGVLCFFTKQYEKSITYYDQAISAIESNENWLRDIENMKDMSYSKLSKFNEITSALRNNQKTKPIDHPSIIDSYVGLYNYFLEHKDYEQGLLFFENLLKERLSILSSKSEEKAVLYSYLGEFHYHLGQFSESIQYLNEGIKSCKKTDFGPLLALNMLTGMSYMYVDNLTAIEYFRKANVLCPQVNNKNLTDRVNGFLEQCYRTASSSHGTSNSGYSGETYSQTRRFLAGELWNYSIENNIPVNKEGFYYILADFEKGKNWKSVYEIIEFDPAIYYRHLAKTFLWKQKDSIEFYYKKSYETALQYYGEQHFLYYLAKREIYNFYNDAIGSWNDTKKNNYYFEQYKKYSDYRFYDAPHLPKLYLPTDFKYPQDFYVAPYFTKIDSIKNIQYKKTVCVDINNNIKTILHNLDDYQEGYNLELAYEFFSNFFGYFGGISKENYYKVENDTETKLKFYKDYVMDKISLDYKLYKYDRHFYSDSLLRMVNIIKLFEDKVQLPQVLSEKEQLEIELQNLDLILKLAQKRNTKLFKNKIEKDSLGLSSLIAGITRANSRLFTLTNDTKYQRNIFEYQEMNKSFVLNQVLKQNNAKSVLENDSLKLEENRLRSQLKQAENRKPFNNAERDRCQQEFDDFKKSNTQYFSNTFPKKMTIDSIQKYLINDTATSVLSFYINLNVQERYDSIYIFLIRKDTFYMHVISKGEPFKQHVFQDTDKGSILKEVISKNNITGWVEQMRHGIYGSYTLSVEDKNNPNLNFDSLKISTRSQYVDAAYDLYQKLIAPLNPYITKRIIIIPDGVIGYLPFEALLEELPRKYPNGTYRNEYDLYRYWGANKILSYAYSATSLKEMIDKKHQILPKDTNAILAFAPFYKGTTAIELQNELKLRTRGGTADSPTWADLNNTRKEVLEVTRYFQGYIRTSINANKERFLQEASKFRIIHLATHAKSDNLTGEKAFIAFCSAKRPEDSDSLYVKDIYNLSLNADLVTLSACEAGIGELKRGEGIISLARAFTYAGAKSIVTTLWEVDDDKTTYLMTYFYENINNGDDKDIALWKAKKTLRDTSKNPHPYFWSAFLPIGDMKRIERH